MNLAIGIACIVLSIILMAPLAQQINLTSREGHGKMHRLGSTKPTIPVREKE